MRNTNLKRSFGAEVKRRRTSLGISQEELAQRAELHRTYVSDVEAGKRNPSLASIERLARALGIPLSTVFDSAEHTDERRRPVAAGPLGPPADILLLADNPETIASILETFRHAKLANNLEVASDGMANLDFIFCRKRNSRKHTRYPHVIVLDLELAREDGLQVLRRLKADERTRYIPVVVLTGARKGPRAREALRLGAGDCIMKPLNFQSFSRITPKLSCGWALLRPQPHAYL